MACNTPQDPCYKPCPEPYDNCGCINPTTLNCVTDKSTGLTADQVVQSIKQDIVNLKLDSGKVALSPSDTCYGYLPDKLEAGLNISFSYEGVGCERKLVINAVEGGELVDQNVKVTSGDTTSGYLFDKITQGVYIKKTVLNTGGNETLRLDILPSDLISAEAGNMLTIGSDNKLKTTYTAPDGTETKIIEGAGITVTGTGSTTDPFIISSNPTIQVAKPCFDNTWRPLTIALTGNSAVTFLSGNPEFRYRFDGTLEFRGNISYTVNFGDYYSANRRFVIPLTAIPTTCVSAIELAGQSDLKGINYIDNFGASADQITQQFGYVVRKTNQNLSIELQSSFVTATTKTLVVSLDSISIHPNF